MNSIKEIYLDFSPLSSIKSDVINFAAPGSEVSTRQSHIPRAENSKTRGFTLSLKNFLIYGLIEGNILSLTITRTISTPTAGFPDKAFLKKYKLILTDLILDSVTAVAKTEGTFLLTVFTVDSQIKQVEFDMERMTSSSSSGAFDKNYQIVIADFLSFNDKSSYFALGSVTGSVFIVKLEAAGRQLNYDILEEVRRAPTNLTEKLTSFLPTNLNFFSSRPTNEAVCSIKYLGNRLIAILSENFQFRIYSLNKKKEVYSNCLIKNRTNEVVTASKINFMTLALNQQEVMEMRSKCFTFTIYLQYNFLNVVQSFDLWFVNVPELQEQNLSTIISAGFESYYDSIDLGADTKLRNTRVYKCEGSVIDAIQYENKIWTLVEEIQDEYTKYEIKVFSSESSQEAETVCFLDDSVTNTINILHQIKLFKHFHIRRGKVDPTNELILCLLENEDYIPTSLLQTFFSNEHSTLMLNKSELINSLIKALEKDNFQGLEKFTSSMLNEELENKIISIGSFTNNEINSLSFVRKKGLSLLKNLKGLSKINNRINHHEHILRAMIFSSSNAEKYQSHNMLHLADLQTKIYNYFTMEPKEDVLFIIIAILRIYTTETTLFLGNERYLLKFFEENDFRGFLERHFTQSLTNQYSNLSYLDFLHQIIYTIYFNNRILIEEGVQAILREYEDYTQQRRDITESLVRVDRSRFPSNEKINSKFCEILSMLVKGKISDFYNVARDLMTFKHWKKTYLKERDHEGCYSRIKKMFIDCYSCYILSSHLCKVSQSSVFERVSLVMPSDLANKDLECDFISLSIYETLSQFGSKVFQEIQNEYIDFIILNIWADVKTGHVEETINDPNRRRRFNVISKLQHMKEVRLVTLLSKLQDEVSLENHFLQVISWTEIGGEEGVSNMKKALNNLFSLLIESSGDDMRLFRNFYATISLDRVNEDSERESQVNNILLGYYYLEEKIKRLLTKETKYEFYFNCYTFIYPTLLQLDNFDQDKIEDFLFNMVKSCLEVDIEMAISFYLSIKDSLKREGFKKQVVEIFVNFLLDNPSASLAKLIGDRELMEQICTNLETKCQQMKEMPKMLNLLKAHCGLQIEANLLQNLVLNTFSEREKFHNYFVSLSSIYKKLGYSQKTALTVYSYAEAIDSVIKMNTFGLSDLVLIYTERKNAECVVLDQLRDILQHDTNPVFIKTETKEINFVTLEEIEREYLLTELRIKILQSLENSNLTLEEVNKIQNTKNMLNIIFSHKLEVLIIEHKLISKGVFEDSVVKKIIVNFIKVNYRPSPRKLNSLFLDIIQSNQINYVFEALEALILFNSENVLPPLLTDEAEMKNSKRLMELYIKYSRVEDFILVFVRSLKRQDQRTPFYLLDIAKTIKNIPRGISDFINSVKY